MTSEALLSAMCKYPAEGTPAYFNFVFDVPRFVHAVTLIGNPLSDFRETKEWFVTLGSLTGASITSNTVFGRYVNANFDRVGREIKIGAMGQSLGIYRNDGVYLSFRWIAVFTTASNCSGPFDWSSSRTDWRIPITSSAQVITGIIAAKIDDCAVFQGQLVLADGSALPSHITYDIYTKIATVNVSAPQAPVTITVNACANLNDKVT